MASANFERALDAVLRHEGGYSDHPQDPGGATNLGITRAVLADWRGRPASKAEVKALTRGEAAAIYRSLFWDRIEGDDLPSGVDLAVFDFSVNSGPKRAARALQAALGVAADGIVGPATIAAAGNHAAAVLVQETSRMRLSFLERLRGFAVFGRGWRRRVREIETLATSLCS